MRYIKHFEDIERLRYWLIPTDRERYKDAVKKIGAGKEWIERDYSDKGEYIYFTAEQYVDGTFGYGWMDYPDGEQWLINKIYKYKGTINIEPHELTANKYNL